MKKIINLLYSKYLGYPSKGLIEILFNENNLERVSNKYECIAHTWRYDSTMKTLEDVGDLYNCTRERVRQCLLKFYRVYK